MSLLAIDFGGTRTRAAWYIRQPDSPEPVQLRRDEILSRTADPQEAVIARLIALAQSVIPAGEKPEAIGIAAPGPADNANGLIYHSYALPGWENVPLGTILEKAFGCPVYMQNDGNLGAVAEKTGGAGRSANPMIYMTISTGIGGGVMLDGRLFTGWSGLAAEPGHIIVTTPEGEHVRLEAVASGTGIGERARRLLATTDYPSLLRDVEVVTGAAVGAAARQGDALASDVITVAGECLGMGLVTLLHLFSPEAIVIGGSAAKLGDLLFTPARQTVEKLVLDPRFLPPDLIRPAHYGEDVCLIGAAMWAARGGQ